MTVHSGEILRGVAELVNTLMPSIAERRYDVSWKSDGSPVTQADVMVEHEIAAFLQRRIPGLRFIGEETFSEEQTGATEWLAVLDPIDGTENFCSGLPEWGVSLSLWHRGRHEASMLMLPELGETLMTGDRVPERRSRIVGLSSSLSSELLEHAASVREARIVGCAVYNLLRVVTGSYARFVNPVGAYSWDLLAGVMLALEHGCEVLIDGEPYEGHYLEPGRRYRVDIINPSGGDPREGR